MQGCNDFRTVETPPCCPVCWPFAVDWAVAYVTPQKTECGVCFFVTVDICECHLRLSEMTRPRYGLLFTCSRMASFKLEEVSFVFYTEDACIYNCNFVKLHNFENSLFDGDLV